MKPRTNVNLHLDGSEHIETVTMGEWTALRIVGSTGTTVIHFPDEPDGLLGEFGDAIVRLRALSRTRVVA